MRCRTTIERGVRAGRTVRRLLAEPVLSGRPQHGPPPLSRIIRISPQEGADRTSLHRILVRTFTILRGFQVGCYSEFIKHLGI